MSEFSADKFIDEQVQDVPLPYGLLERLHQIAPGENPQTRISQAGIWTNREIDEELCNLPTPVTLFAALHQTACHQPASSIEQAAHEPTRETEIEDKTLDSFLREVPVPSHLAGQLEVIPFLRDRFRRKAWVAAAALMLLTAITYGASFAVVLANVFPVDEPQPTQVVDISAPSMATAPSEAERALQRITIAESNLRPPFPRKPLPRTRSTIRRVELPDVDLLRERQSVVSEFQRALRNGYQPGQDLLELRWGLLSAPHSRHENLPDLVVVPAPKPRGLAAPIVQGYDRDFLRKHRDHPLVNPSADPQLATSTPPLSMRTDSFDAAVRHSAENRLPDPKDIRVEDFLAAMDYRFRPPRAGELGIRTAAGSSVFGRPVRGLAPQMLLVGVQSGPLKPTPPKDKPVHLTVALDVSASMQRSGRFETARQGLLRLVRNLRPGDRFSLVGFGEQAHRLVESAGPQHVAEMTEMLKSLHAFGGTDLSAGLRLGLSTALQDKFASDGRFVVISDSRFALVSTTRQVRELLAMAADEGLKTTFLDLSGGGSSSLLSELAAAAQGSHHAPESSADLYYKLMECLHGRGMRTARDVRLRVAFKPQSVAYYRLVGHAPSLAAAETAAEAVVEMRAGESAAVLFEIWLRHGDHPLVAAAELTWKDENGKPHRRRQPISRLQFEPSFAGAPLPLQSATLAAETAQVLGRSYFSRSSRGDLQHVIEAISHVNIHLQQREEFKQFEERVKHWNDISLGRTR